MFTGVTYLSGRFYKERLFSNMKTQRHLHFHPEWYAPRHFTVCHAVFLWSPFIVAGGACGTGSLFGRNVHGKCRHVLHLPQSAPKLGVYHRHRDELRDQFFAIGERREETCLRLTGFGFARSACCNIQFFVKGSQASRYRFSRGNLSRELETGP